MWLAVRRLTIAAPREVGGGEGLTRHVHVAVDVPHLRLATTPASALSHRPTGQSGPVSITGPPASSVIGALESRRGSADWRCPRPRACGSPRTGSAAGYQGYRRCLRPQ
jgi:hypothetical protein